MATMSSGFYSTTQNWNAYNTLLSAFVDFSVPQAWTKLQNGYDSAATSDGQAIRRAWRKDLQKYAIVRPRDRRNAPEVIKMRLEAPGVPAWTQRARNVILAIPPRSVCLLNQDTFLFAAISSWTT